MDGPSLKNVYPPVGENQVFELDEHTAMINYGSNTMAEESVTSTSSGHDRTFSFIELL